MGFEPGGTTRRMRVTFWEKYSPNAEVWSGDEILAGGIVQRLEDMFERAKRRNETAQAEQDPARPQPPSPAETRQHRSAPPPAAVDAAKPSAFRRIAYNPWVIALGSGVVLVVLGIVLTIWLT